VAKKLITKNNFTDFVCKKNNTIYVDHSMILSPGVKDILRDRGITIVYGDRKKVKEEAVQCVNWELAHGECRSNTESDLENTIINILRKDFNIFDNEVTGKIVGNVLRIIHK
jgi:hypothetical protein